MAWGIVAGAAVSVVGGAMASSSANRAAGRAADAQVEAAQLGVDEQRRQFDKIQELLSPFANAGSGALTQQQAILGLNGQGQQAEAINAIRTSPAFQSMVQQGENSILQNASATGGLRGGNVQAALAQFSPRLLADTINQRYAQLGGITSLGQNAAALTGNAGMQTGGNISNLLQQSGAAQAGGYLAQGRAQAGMINAPFQALGAYRGMGGQFGGWGGSTPAADQETANAAAYAYGG